MYRSLLILGLGLIASVVSAQTPYRYSVNLKAVRNDKLEVSLLTPPIASRTTVYSFPKIIPGTYSISDYGKFVDSLRAFDVKGRQLKVLRLNDNQWQISNAHQMSKITYLVDDIFDSATKHNIYPMAATNIEDKNIVVHPPGFFGYFDHIRQSPVELSFQKPQNFYASTSLTPVSSTATTDLFRLNNIDELYDSPIMYNIPDTATLQVANCKVLVSVYSPNKVINAKEISTWLSSLLHAAKNYLGGKLPADKYAFLYYFRDPKAVHSFRPGLGGALEHTTSSFYYLGEGSPQALKSTIVDISSHEFFHIITPLTIASREIKEFNFNEPVMSKHLWLYEGSTEYTSDHVQVQGGLNSPQEFLDKLSEKITNSKQQYNDTLSFTELSKLAASRHEAQYGNVYEKGALIAACLDLLLLNESAGRYGLKHLTHDLGVRYGRNRYFNDDELFEVIAELSYPQAREFLTRHVHGNTPIPYDYYFRLAGIKYLPVTQKKVISFGGITPALNQKGVLFVSPASRFNEFGETLGYKVGDELYAFNGHPVGASTFAQVVADLKSSLKQGEIFSVKIGRPGGSGKVDTMILSAPVHFISQTEQNTLEMIENPSSQQLLVRQAWLEGSNAALETVISPRAYPQDVASIDAIIKALYSAISGPAGSRNWDRFHSLFLPEARMETIRISSAGGEPQYLSISPQEYEKSNAPFFARSPYAEEELGRKVSSYGNIAFVQSAYQSRVNGKVNERGLNHISLVKAKGRWWISGITWQQEAKDKPIPKDLLRK